ncbi:MAG TPA: hypothetical protein VFN04_02005 [Protaetiibacter sp.]|nr:hypothetical protein [Protaetiibacter sp.]
MEHTDSDVEETVVVDRAADSDLDHTIVRPSRRARARTAAADDADDSVEATIVVDRSHDAVEETIVVDRSGRGDEETIVVDRRPQLLGVDDDDDDDDTDRSESRPALPAQDEDTDRTVARERDDSDEQTITVDRSASAAKLPPVPSLRRARVQRRRGIAPPPVPVGFAPAARAAVGPGAVDHYSPRELRPPPEARAVPEGGVAPTRVIDPNLPSVARRARRTAVLALAAFAGACVVSVTGLTLILLWVF